MEKNPRQKPFEWLPDQGWEDLMKLTTVQPDIFGSLADDVERNEKTWKYVSSDQLFYYLLSASEHTFQWFDLDAPESAPFPGKYRESLSDLQCLMLLRCFRVDRVYRAITNFVMGRMGEQYVTPPVVSLESVYDQSSPYSPIVFILSPGADPAGELGKLADIKGYGGNRFKFLAMGQGQEKVCQCHAYW